MQLGKKLEAGFVSDDAQVTVGGEVAPPPQEADAPAPGPAPSPDPEPEPAAAG